MKVVAISDLHCGSKVGLCDVSSKEVPGGDAGAPVRAALWEHWKDATSGKWSKPDVLLVLGDCVDGQNKKQSGLGTWTSDLAVQCDHAAALIQMWGAKRVYMVRGSDYHVDANSTGFQCEEYISRKIKAEEYPHQDGVPVDRRDHSGWHWYVTASGVTFHISHKIGMSTVFHYKSTPTAREMLYAKLNDMLRHSIEKFKTNIVLRGHAHYYNLVEYSSSMGMVVPCWKALDDYAMKIGAIALSPDLGYIGFDCNEGRWSTEKNLFKLTDVQEAPHVVVGEK